MPAVTYFVAIEQTWLAIRSQFRGVERIYFWNNQRRDFPNPRARRARCYRTIFDDIPFHVCLCAINHRALPVRQRSQAAEREKTGFQDRSFQIRSRFAEKGRDWERTTSRKTHVRLKGNYTSESVLVRSILRWSILLINTRSIDRSPWHEGRRALRISIFHSFDGFLR